MGSDGPSPPAATISLAEVVTIPAAEYAELLECRHRLDTGRIARTRGSLRSPIARDPEVASFLADNLGRARLRQVHAACLERFGAARTPSLSAIDRFWARLRGPVGKCCHCIRGPA